MDRQVINSSKVTPLRSSMSHAVRVGGLVFVSGATPFAGDRSIAHGNFAAQTHQMMRNIEAVLQECGSSLAMGVKFNVALKNMAYFREFDTIFRTYFEEGNFPARMSTESQNLAHPDFMLAIDCVAACPD